MKATKKSISNHRAICIVPLILAFIQQRSLLWILNNKSRMNKTLVKNSNFSIWVNKSQIPPNFQFLKKYQQFQSHYVLKRTGKAIMKSFMHRMNNANNNNNLKSR